MFYSDTARTTVVTVNVEKVWKMPTATVNLSNTAEAPVSTQDIISYRSLDDVTRQNEAQRSSFASEIYNSALGLDAVTGYTAEAPEITKNTVPYDSFDDVARQNDAYASRFASAVGRTVLGFDVGSGNLNNTDQVPGTTQNAVPYVTFDDVARKDEASRRPFAPVVQDTAP